MARALRAASTSAEGDRPVRGQGQGHLERGQGGPGVAVDQADERATASSSAVAPSWVRARRTTVGQAPSSRGSRRNRVERLRSGALTEKYGFSVVAPIRIRVPSSTDGQEGVLLGPVEAVHLVEEQDGAPILLAEEPAGARRRCPGRP